MYLRLPVCGVEISDRVQMYVKAPSFGGVLTLEGGMYEARSILFYCE